MNNYFKSCLFLLFILFVFGAYSDNSLTLFVDQSSKSVDPKCGLTVDNSCSTILLAYKSYSLQTDGNNSTALSLSLADGTYSAQDNGLDGNTDSIYLKLFSIFSTSKNYENVILTNSNALNPFFQYIVPSANVSELTVSNITFVNSTSIVAANSFIDVNFLNCVFTNTSSTINSPLVYLIAPDNINPSFVLVNSQVSRINISANIFEIQGYSTLVSNVTANQINGTAVFSVSDSMIQFMNITLTNSQTYYSPLYITSSNVTINNSAFNSNSGGSAGAVYVSQDGDPYSSINIYQSNFTYNQTPRQGGALYIVSTAVSQIQQSSFYFNRAYGSNVDQYGPETNGTGGAVYLNSRSISFHSCGFLNNTANSLGGAIYSTLSNVWIDYSAFQANNAQQGGAIYSSSSFYGINFIIYTNNTATNNGTNFLCENSKVDLENNGFFIPNDGYYCPVENCKFTTYPLQTFICAPSVPSNSSSDSKSSSDHHKSNGPILTKKELAIIIGCTIGGVIFFIIIAVLIIKRCRHHHHHHHKYSPIH